MKNLPLIFLAVLLLICTYILTSCVTVQDYQKRLDNWIGHSSIELVEVMGGPNSAVKVADNQEVYTYDLKFDYSHNPAYSDLIHIRWCKLTFFIKGNVITKVAWQGNNCY